MKVNLLTAGPESYNARALLYPLLKYRKAISDSGINLKVFLEIASNITDADILIVDSKFFRSWYPHKLDEMYLQLEKFSNNINLMFFDTTDSSGYVLGDVLPYVTKYFKHQVLVDKKQYFNPMYGRRLYSDFYHKNFRVSDAIDHEEKSNNILNVNDVEKISCAWNTGLSNYSLLGEYYAKLYKMTGFKALFLHSFPFLKNNYSRSKSIQCRMNTYYSKESVAFHRKKLANLLDKNIQTDKLNRFQYFKELKMTKVIISAFGLGEITLKDFETFLTGGTLVKPDMSHMETWPNFYENNITYIPFRWDFKDLHSVIESILEDEGLLNEISHESQKRYFHHLFGLDAQKKFVSRLHKIIN